MPGDQQPSASSRPDNSPAAGFAERRARFSVRAEQLARRSDRLANLRLLLFLFALVGVTAGLLIPLLPLALIGLAGLAGFVVLVRAHRRVELERRRQAGLAEINHEAGLRLARDWSALPLRHGARAAAEHAYALDLDLFGRASLLQLLDTTGSWLGERCLSGWLLGPASPELIQARQRAVAELAPLIDLRDELTWLGRANGEPRGDPAPILEWAEGPLWLADRRALLWAARLSPPLLIGLLALQLAGLLEWPLFLLPLVVNLWLSQRLGGSAVAVIRLVGSLGAQLGGYAAALELVAGSQLESASLRALQGRLAAEGWSAPLAIRRLRRLAALAQPTTSQLYPLIELATLWNVHVLDLLERWQRSEGRRVRDWLEALGEVEALAALAGLCQAHPDWVFPEVDPAADRLSARGLAHPLLVDERAVANDLEVGPAGSFLLVTGSNMSGKSTLLRAIGLNVVLAQAGGPVCARALRLPPLRLWSSMRISDSLEEGVSYFMSELRRLKLVVDAAAPGVAGEPGLLYLLDEILQGTNTAERQIAARRIIRLLLSRPAIGVVSTHDLTLADAPDLAAAARSVHLTETVSDGAAGVVMSFDYRLRPGVARSTNALRLLEMVGLPSE